MVVAQQTLGGITGTVSDSSGGVVAGVTITLVEEHTGLSREAKTNASGEYLFPNLPIGDYVLTYTGQGFETQKLPHIGVQGQRTATLNVQLKPGAASTTIEVQETPLLNAVDTTNGYILERAQIDSIRCSRPVALPAVVVQSGGHKRLRFQQQMPLQCDIQC